MAAEVQAEKFVRRLCGYQYERTLAECTAQLFVVYRVCRSVEETIRRGLGTTQDLAGWSQSIICFLKKGIGSAQTSQCGT